MNEQALPEELLEDRRAPQERTEIRSIREAIQAMKTPSGFLLDHATAMEFMNHQANLWNRACNRHNIEFLLAAYDDAMEELETLKGKTTQ